MCSLPRGVAENTIIGHIHTLCHEFLSHYEQYCSLNILCHEIMARNTEIRGCGVPCHDGAAENTTGMGNNHDVCPIFPVLTRDHRTNNTRAVAENDQQRSIYILCHGIWHTI